MAMGKRKKHRQQPLFLAAADLAKTPAHPFYAKLNEVLAGWKFDELVEGLCRPFYAEVMGRPSLAPGVYFRLLLIGYFEGIDSERGIAWRCGDSLSLRAFAGYGIGEAVADHSTISRTRRLIDLETHQQVFTWVLKVLADYDLLSGKTLGVDATTLEANAAMRSIVRRDTKETYAAFLTKLAKESGVETPTREDLARIDKKRKNKASNADWEHPHDPDAKVAKMKDGTTHLAHKAEHAVDLGEGGHGAVLAVALHGADEGDTSTLVPTINQASENLRAVADDGRVADKVDPAWASEVATDKGYHANGTMADLAEMEVRSYVPEPDRSHLSESGERDWAGKPEAKRATYANRRRMRGPRAKRLMRRRGELIERSFAHCYETGGMRRVRLRGRANILKRLLVHTGGFNLSLVMRKLVGKGTPRGLQGAVSGLARPVLGAWVILASIRRAFGDLVGFSRALERAPMAA